jgi:hypothetical protein
VSSSTTTTRPVFLTELIMSIIRAAGVWG